MIRLTIRATDESVPAVLLKLMQGRLARGYAAPNDSRGLTKRDIHDAFGHVMVTPEDDR